MQSDRCYHCGTPNVADRAHVFPRQWFVPINGVRPSNLLTVPSCEAHNHPYRLDEELFAFALNDYDHWYARAVWDRMRRGFQRPEQAKFRRMLASNISPLLVPRPGGGYGYPVTFDERRLKVVLENVARGLTYLHGDVVLPAGTDFTFGMFGDLRRGEEPTIIRDMAAGASVRRRLGSVFDYQWGKVQDEPGGTFTRFSFFGTRIFVVVTVPPGMTQLDGAKGLVLPRV